MLAWLGHPERQARQTVLITGTNGKGSVAATLSAISTSAGRRTGLFTSPHLVRVHERFRTQDTDIDDASFDRVGGRVLRAIRDSGIPLSFFEAMVTLAVLRFEEQGCEVQILEAGLGGRRDGTRPATPTHAVVTNVAMDHAKTLGPTLEHIAHEKLDICEPGARSVVSLPPRLRHLTPPNAWLVPRDVRHRRTSTGLRVHTPAATLTLPNPTLVGPHQRRNLALAAATATQMGFTEAEIAQGAARVRWPARMQRISTAPDTYLDGAHNPNAVAAILTTLTELGIPDGFTLVFGAHPRKNAAPMLRRYAPHAGTIITTTAPLLQPAADLAATLPDRPNVHPIPDCAEALSEARALGHPVLVTGSLYLAGAILAHID